MKRCSALFFVFFLCVVFSCKAQDIQSLNLDFEAWELSNDSITDPILLDRLFEGAETAIPRGYPLMWKGHSPQFYFRSEDAVSGEFAFGNYHASAFNPFTIFGLVPAGEQLAWELVTSADSSKRMVLENWVEWRTPVSKVSGYLKKPLEDTIAMDVVFEAAVEDSLSGEKIVVGRGFAQVEATGEYEPFELSIEYDSTIQELDYIKFYFYQSNVGFNTAYARYLDNVQFDLITSTFGPAATEHCYQLYPNPVSGNEVFLTSDCPTDSDLQKLMLLDHGGRTVWHGSVDGQEARVPLAALPAGMYRLLSKMKNGSTSVFPLIIR